MISIKNEILKPVSLTFSKKNLDVADILDEISKDGTKKTDYICEAVRFYYEHGGINNTNSLRVEELEGKFKELFYKYMGIYQNENKVPKDTIFDLAGIDKSDLEDD